MIKEAILMEAQLDYFSFRERVMWMAIYKSNKAAHGQRSLHLQEVCSSLFSRSKASKVKNATFPPLIAVSACTVSIQP